VSDLMEGDAARRIHACELHSADSLIHNAHQSQGAPPWPSPST
jgi:hypothetical protein